MSIYSLKTLCADTVKKNDIEYNKRDLPNEMYEFLETFPNDFISNCNSGTFMPLDSSLKVYIQNNPFISTKGANLHRAIDSGCFELVKELFEIDDRLIEARQYVSNHFGKEYISALELLCRKVNKLTKNIKYYIEIQDFILNKLKP